MKIAVIGSGISGLGAAYALKDQHDVTVFEADNRFGGHANTQIADFNGRQVAVDTGFIVYNYRNYPNLTGLFEHLDVRTKWSDMSFGVSLESGKVEYAFDSLDKIFAQRKNVLKPRFLRLLGEIKRFNQTAPGHLDSGALDYIALGDWTEREGYSEWFRQRFILPMGGAIWSTPIADVLDFPARNFVSFFRNHDLMTGLDAAQRWRTVEGGSRNYVTRIVSELGSRAKAGARVVAVDRSQGRPSVTFADGQKASFDQVIFAVHGPTAAHLLQNQTQMEREILGGFRTSYNEAILHSDPSLMPKRRKVWSSWNFLTETAADDPTRPAPVTYWMNRLQLLPEETPLFVSLNPANAPDPSLVHGTFNYSHPVFEHGTFELQQRVDHIQGNGGVWYAGAWLGYGFHEDGLRAGLRVAASLGAAPSWAKDMPAPIETLLEAAE